MINWYQYKDRLRRLCTYDEDLRPGHLEDIIMDLIIDLKYLTDRIDLRDRVLPASGDTDAIKKDYAELKTEFHDLKKSHEHLIDSLSKVLKEKP